MKEQEPTPLPEMIAEDGGTIQIGDVLINVNDKARGVVIDIAQRGKLHRYAGIPHNHGDLTIMITTGLQRITNRYDQWKHIDHDQQTPLERYRSFCVRPPNIDEDDESISQDEQYAVAGILALLPSWFTDDVRELGAPRFLEVLKVMAEYAESQRERLEKLHATPESQP